MIELIKMYCDKHLEAKKAGQDPWFMLKHAVAMELFTDQYKKLTGSEIPTIENLPEAEKLKYWNIACQYFTDKEKRIAAAKVIYMITLITEDEVHDS